jgi:putative endonuclease
MKQPAVYILSNRKNGTLYTGVTSNLLERVYKHKEEITKGFSSKYDCKMLVFYEVHETLESEILREKQIKGGSRNRKIQLIQKMNPEWQDLYSGLSL